MKQLEKMGNKVIIWACISGAKAVALGAIGAHLLKNKLDPYSISIFEKAVTYQFYHTLALLFVGILFLKENNRLLFRSAQLFLIGILLFCGSLYILALRPVFGLSLNELKWLGAITPFGGLSFIAAWLLVGYSFLKKPI